MILTQAEISALNTLFGLIKRANIVHIVFISLVWHYFYNLTGHCPAAQTKKIQPRLSFDTKPRRTKCRISYSISILNVTYLLYAVNVVGIVPIHNITDMAFIYSS